MKAAIITRAGGPEVLEVHDVPQPQPTAKEVLVRVKASALNRADLLQRQGKYPAPADAPQDIPGMEFAGEIAGAGSEAKRWRLGQRVFGITGGGAHAEFVTAHEDVLAEVPQNLSWSQAGAIPEVCITAHDAMIMQAELKAGERVLIHAVGSGVGLAAVQLARAIGALPFGTSRTLDKIEAAKAYGLEAGLTTKDPINDLEEFAQRVTNGRGFDVVLDLNGGPYFSASLHALGLHGRLVIIGAVAGATANIELYQVLRKRLHIIGTVLRGRSLEEKAKVTQAFSEQVLPLFASGKIQPVIDSEFSLDQIQAAHQRLESNASIGKVVLLIS